MCGQNLYAAYLKEAGHLVMQVDKIDWHCYNGFMVPAYLPHCVPAIQAQTAQKVLSSSKKPFIRWDSSFCKIQDSQWWYVLKKGKWDIADVSDKKKRWMIKQGKKRFSTQPVSYEQATLLCPDVASKAAERYRGKTAIETPETLLKRTRAGMQVPGVLEYFGCFDGDQLVSFSENYIQCDAVWLSIIRHDPHYLGSYSSYALMDGILDYYLNQRGFLYVLDGCRSIHHKTNFQEHLIKNFNFTREYAKLNLIYAPAFGFVAKSVYPSRYLFWKLAEKTNNGLICNVSAILKQECIRRACMSLHPKVDDQSL